MTSAVMSLLDNAMALSIDEQAELVVELLARIDGARDPDAGEAWAREIERRARRVMSGESKGTDWSVIQARAAARLRA